MGLIDRLFGRDEDAHRTTTPDDLGIASANYAACQAEIAARNEEAQRHKELMGALGRIEAALCRWLDEKAASIKNDWQGEPDGVTNTLTIKHADGTSTTREYKTDFLYSKKAEVRGAFKVGDRVTLKDVGQYDGRYAGAVEWCENETCCVKFDGHPLMPSVVIPCASLKRDVRHFQIGDRVRAPLFQPGEGTITKTHGKGFIVEYPYVAYYFEAEHLELIKGEE